MEKASDRSTLGRLARSPDAWAFLLFSLVKSAMAVAGFHALFGWGRQVWRPGGHVAVPRARAWLWAYVWMQFADTAQALRQGYDWTSLVHHLASGLGFAADAFFGTDRTAALSIMALAGEAVAPFYQAYGLLKSAGLGSSRLATRCIQGVIFCTLFARLPLAAFLGTVACRDTSCLGGGGGERGRVRTTWSKRS
mmetsp:Transcript_80653/g.226890  ORF Transcript_80653/g.226890 Transcript_80653/m.226890 type:complete len:194 (-) Transcript_80653:159-740(-)